MHSPNPCLSVESVVNAHNRVQDISRPRNQDRAQLVRQLSRILYKSALFMQNKANFRKGRTSVNTYNNKGYENLGVWRLGKNKANQSQLKPKPMSRWICTIDERRLETGGIEPPFPRCDRGVLPLYHVPGFTRIPYFSKPFLNSRLGITVLS